MVLVRGIKIHTYIMIYFCRNEQNSIGKSSPQIVLLLECFLVKSNENPKTFIVDKMYIHYDFEQIQIINNIFAQSLFFSYEINRFTVKKI